MVLANKLNVELYSAEALERRQHEVAGRPQRIAELQLEEIGAPLRELNRRIRAASGAADLNIIHGYLRTVAKHPDVFRCQMETGAVLFQGCLSNRDRELAVLRIGWLLRAPFEWGEHVRISARHGITPEEVARTIVGSSAPEWTEHETAVLRGVEELLSDQSLSDETWATLARSWDEAQLIEFPMMVGQYIATALMQNALRIRLSHDNRGFSRR